MNDKKILKLSFWRQKHCFKSKKAREFPQIKGFSTRNLKYMRRFAVVYPEFSFVQQVAAQIPWFHNCTIIDKVKERAHREWYILSARCSRVQTNQ